MSQVTATFSRTIRVFLWKRSMLFWTIAWPIIWVLIDSFAFVGDTPKNVIPYIRGSITISMMVFALTIAGMTNLPDNIATDSGSGLFAKLMSMPISPWKRFQRQNFRAGGFFA